MSTIFFTRRTTPRNFGAWLSSSLRAWKRPMPIIMERVIIRSLIVSFAFLPMRHKIHNINKNIFKTRNTKTMNTQVKIKSSLYICKIK